jgi:rod shape-determining protein MreC
MFRTNRIVSFAVALLFVLGLMAFSARGALGPFEGVVAIPLNLLEAVIGRPTRGVSSFIDQAANYRDLQQRNRDLEEALAIYQAELAQITEKADDYDRLAALVNYNRSSPADREYVTCDVIGTDTVGFVSAIQINCGRRDGVNKLDPVVTELGLVGRVVQVSATGAEVQLVSDPASKVNARLQTTREDGVVFGQLGGDLLMSYIPIDAQVQEGDRVMTNGLGQMLPENLLVGQVLSVSLSENELYQEARVRSLVDFNRLEIVQVVINFEPVELSVFQRDQGTTP